MEPHVIELGCGPDATPGLFDVHKVPSWLLSTNYEGIVFEPGNGM